MIITICLLLFLLDFTLKIYSNKKLKNYDKKVIYDKLILCYLENHGIAFNYFSGRNKSIIIVNISYLVYLIYNFVDNNNSQIGLLFIITGGVGNLFDRVLRGYVIDYIYIKLKNLPVFNLSDLYILTGVVFCIIDI